MFRPSYTILMKLALPSLRGNIKTRIFYSTKSRPTKSTAKLTLISASVGLIAGAGYGGYTHYKINTKKNRLPTENDDFLFLKEAPAYKPQYKVINENDTSNLQLVLFQYRTCPFCCKVRAYLDSKGISYEVVEVDAVLRQAIKWSGYKKVPILLAKVDGGYQQLLDSSAVISILETYLQNGSTSIQELLKFYPNTKYVNESGKEITEIANKYFIMHNKVTSSQKMEAESEERKWRQWADNVLVHTLSPNVYRTASEALETFKWFEDAGGWKQSFPAWECSLMVYVGAFAMWIIAKRLKARHNIGDDVRQSLYDAANQWMSAVKSKGARFLGGDNPNLADITVYGVLSSIEGCQAFQDMRNNTDISEWYDNIKNTINIRQGKVQAVVAYA